MDLTNDSVRVASDVGVKPTSLAQELLKRAIGKKAPKTQSAETGTHFQVTQGGW